MPGSIEADELAAHAAVHDQPPSMRDLGGVLSIARTSTSRHEQQSANTTLHEPTPQVRVAYCRVCDYAARANTRTSSMRFTTAARVATQIAIGRRVEKRRGTTAPSPHSTPIDAQFTVPSSAMVVTIVSTITGVCTLRPGAWGVKPLTVQ